MKLDYSFIIPVYNRPEEIKELLESMLLLDFSNSFEIVIVEDGSTISSKDVVAQFQDKLHISYFEKPNSGPGSSRNYGMQRANGNYYLILDSDVILPSDYLKEVNSFLQHNYCDCFGGPDAAHQSFSDVQKAIDYSMTSFLTTGGIRGKKRALGKFQPRSFNMGLSQKAFEATGGFGQIHPGEDPDLSLRLRKLNFDTCLIPSAKVFHKRRIDWHKFYHQVYKFGMVRPILNKWHVGSAKLTYWFPSLFMIGFIIAIAFAFFGWWWFVAMYVTYLLIIGISAGLKFKSLKIGMLAIRATMVQFTGYGYGFLRSSWNVLLLKKDPRIAFPNLFFKNE